MTLSRNFTNVVNWVLDNLVPPSFRDSQILMKPVFFLLFGKRWRLFMQFKEKVSGLSEKEIITYYEKLSDVHIKRETDLNKESIDFIMKNITDGEQVLDIACGRGFLSNEMVKNHNVIVKGVDFIISDQLKDSTNPLFLEDNIMFICFGEIHLVSGTDLISAIQENLVLFFETLKQ